MLTLRINPANNEGESKLAMVLRVIPWPLDNIYDLFLTTELTSADSDSGN